MEGVPVAQCPGSQRKDGAKGRRQYRQGSTKWASTAIARGQGGPQHRRQHRGGEQALLRSQQDGRGDGGGRDPQPAVEVAPSVLPAGKPVEGQRDRRQRKGFCKRRRDVVCGKWTECREPKHNQRRAAAKEASGQRAGQAAGHEVGGDLSVHHGAVVFHAEDAEAGCEKERVAGQPDQGGDHS